MEKLCTSLLDFYLNMWPDFSRPNSSKEGRALVATKDLGATNLISHGCWFGQISSTPTLIRKMLIEMLVTELPSFPAFDKGNPPSIYEKEFQKSDHWIYP